MNASLPARFAAYIAGLRDAGEAPTLAHYPDLPAQVWYDAATIPLARDLEAAAPAIAAEFHALDPHAFAPEHEPIARDGGWDVIMLYERGRRHDDRLAQCPTLDTVLGGHRTVRSLAGLAYFSRLAAHTHVAAHAGPTNMRVRIHLGIDIPADCGIRVDDRTTTWSDGRCLAFSDAFSHEVWNESERERIVLVADIWHPDLSDDEVGLLTNFHRYIERAAAGLDTYWRARRD